MISSIKEAHRSAIFTPYTQPLSCCFIPRQAILCSWSPNEGKTTRGKRGFSSSCVHTTFAIDIVSAHLPFSDLHMTEADPYFKIWICCCHGQLDPMAKAILCKLVLQMQAWPSICRGSIAWTLCGYRNCRYGRTLYK